MTVPIQIIGSSAVLDANPEAKLETFLDHWDSGYLASLGSLKGQYVIKKVIYDIDKVSIDKVREVAKKLDEGLFECPVCQRIATQSAGNNGDGEPLKEDKKEEPVLKEEPAQKEKHKQKPKEEVKEPEPTLEPEFELDDVEIQELERERAIQKIVSAMDEILLMKMMR